MTERKNPERRRAKRLLNAKLDQLQRIENREAELEGREPIDVITQYKRQKALERSNHVVCEENSEIVDAEVVSEESSESVDHGGGRDSVSHLPVPLPKISATEEDSKQAAKNLRRLSEEWWDAQPFDVQMTRCRADLVSGAGRCTNFSVKGARVCYQPRCQGPSCKGRC